MNLFDQSPYWLMKNGIVASYSSLDQNIKLDVAIIGGGISAALTAWYLRNEGLSVAVFDRRHIGMGSTAASTAFLQYEIDTPLTKLSELVGEKNAVLSYQLCKEAIYDIADICTTLTPKFDFKLKHSLQQASYLKHVQPLKDEFNLRKKHGFKIKWLEQRDIKKEFGFDAYAGILSKDGGEVDAYLLTHSLLNKFSTLGHKVFNNTDITEIEYHKKHVLLRTKDGSTIEAKKLIIACGYESLKYIPKKIADIHSTYAFVSEPLNKTTFWYKNSLVWETAMPYMYFRVVDDNRILIGGRDDPFHPPHINPSIINKKCKMLQNAFLKKIPSIPLKPDFCWAGAFAVTKDGLPYIGTIPERPHTYFALGFGGNGITFSVIAAKIIRDLILEKKNPHAHLFDFNR